MADAMLTTAVILGKTAMSEWAFFRSTSGTSGWNGRDGQVRNPFDLARSPGGSSVAASASLAAATIGTETDGSIMSPATANGVVGLKPTVGLTSRAGVIPISPSQARSGPWHGRSLMRQLCSTFWLGLTTATHSAVIHDYEGYIDANGLREAQIGVLGRIEAGRAQFGPDRAGAISREANAKRTIKLAQPLSAAREVWMQTGVHKNEPSRMLDEKHRNWVRDVALLTVEETTQRRRHPTRGERMKTNRW